MSQIQVDNIYNKEATGSPNFPLGVNVTGVVTATTFKGGAEITSGTISGASVSATSVSATTGTFTSNVSIGGTLTYEDVTNIDSVGVVTARNGVKTNVSPSIAIRDGVTEKGYIGFNANDPFIGRKDGVGLSFQNNKIRPVDGDDGSPSTNTVDLGEPTYKFKDGYFAGNLYGNGANLTGIEAAPTIQAVADGSIAAEGSVIVTLESKLAAVVGFNDMTGSEQSFAGDIGEDKNCAAQAWDATNKQIMVLYRNTAVTTYAIVGTVSDQSVTWSSTPLQLSTNAGGQVAVCNISSGVFLAAYRDQDDEYLRVLTVSGTGTNATIALGTPLDLSVGGGQNMQEPNLVYDPDNSKVFFAYKDTSANKGTSKMATISGTGTNATVTVGSGFDITNAGEPTHNLRSCYDTTNNKMIVCWNYGGSNYRTRCLTINGSTITGTNMEQSAFSGFGNENPGIAYDSVNNCFWGVATNTGNGYVYYRQGKYQSSSDNVVWPGDVTAVSGFGGNGAAAQTDGSIRVVCDPSTGKICFFGVHADHSMEILYGPLDTTSGTAALISFSPSVVTFATYAGGGLDAGNPTVLPDGRISVGPYRTDTAGNKGVVKIKQFKSTNANAENFIGFSKAAYTNGQTVTAKVVGNVATKSGLTPGKKYYLQNNGSLATTADDPSIVAGRALSATSLLIQPG